MQHVVVGLTQDTHLELLTHLGIVEIPITASPKSKSMAHCCAKATWEEGSEHGPEQGGKAKHLHHDSWFEPQFVEFLHDCNDIFRKPRGVQHAKHVRDVQLWSPFRSALQRTLSGAGLRSMPGRSPPLPRQTVGISNTVTMSMPDTVSTTTLDSCNSPALSPQMGQWPGRKA